MINVVALCHLPSSKHYVWCSFIGSGDPAFQRPQAKRLKYPEPKETPSQVNFLSLITKLIANGELSSFISKGIYPSPIHEGLSELQRKAETAIAYPLLDKVCNQLSPANPSLWLKKYSDMKTFGMYLEAHTEPVQCKLLTAPDMGIVANWHHVSCLNGIKVLPLSHWERIDYISLVHHAIQACHAA